MLDQTDPANLLADLKRRRADADDRLAELKARLDRLTEAEKVEGDALAAIGELGHAEAAAMKAWAAAGADGAPPTINHTRREQLNRELVIATAQADAVRKAGAHVAEQIATVNGEISGLPFQIELAAIGELIGKYNADRKELDEHVAVLRARTAATYGAHEFLRLRADACRDAGRDGDARALFSLLKHIIAPLPNLAPQPHQISAAVPVWATRFEELIR